jgi:hypothetical protein
MLGRSAPRIISELKARQAASTTEKRIATAVHASVVNAGRAPLIERHIVS